MSKQTRRLKGRVAAAEAWATAANQEVARLRSELTQVQQQLAVSQGISEKLIDKLSAESIIVAVAELINPRPTQPWETEAKLTIPPSPAMDATPYMLDIEIDEDMEQGQWMSSESMNRKTSDRNQTISPPASPVSRDRLPVGGVE